MSVKSFKIKVDFKNIFNKEHKTSSLNASPHSTCIFSLQTALQTIQKVEIISLTSLKFMSK